MQRPPLARLEVVIYKQYAVQNAKAHIETVGQYEADAPSPPCEHVGQDKERNRQAEHDKVIPTGATQIRYYTLCEIAHA